MNRYPRSCHQLGVCQSLPNCEGCSHDTEKLPCGGFYFAPGAIDMPEPKRLSGWRVLVRDAIVVIAVAGLIGFAAGYIQAKGWPL